MAPACAQADEPLIATWEGHAEEVTTVSFTRDGKKVLSAAEDSTLKLWDVATGKTLDTFKGNTEELGAGVISPDGTKILSGGEGHTLKILELATRKELASLKGPRSGIRSIILSPDGRTAATVSFNGGLMLWDIEARKKLATLQKEDTRKVVPGEESGQTMAAVFSPDGKRLLAGEFDYLLRLWDVKTAKLLSIWHGHDDPVVYAVDFSPDGTKALSAGRDNTLRLWDAATGKTLAVWRGHRSHVRAVAFSPDGRIALSGGADYTVRKWDVATGEELAVWKGHRGIIRDVAFSPDGALAVSASDDRTLKLWDVAGEARLAEVPDPAPPARTSPLPPGPGEPRERLGMLLFFDRRLSGDNTLDCSACHRPAQAFTDGMALSEGYSDTSYFRNTPTLYNTAPQAHLYWDGRISGDDMPSLIRDHIAEAHFMNADGRLIVEKLRQAPGYMEAFEQVYGGEPEYGKILDALAAFVRSLNSGDAPYDRFLRGEKDALGRAARRGYELFNGAAGCAECHHGPLLSDGKLHARGVPENPEIYGDDERHTAFLRFFRLFGVWGYQNLRRDIGYSAITKNAADEGKFKTPPLREVGRTAPYMHNGVIQTLDEAIALENPGLSRRQRKDIAQFLRSLSGDNPIISAPPVPEYAVSGRSPHKPSKTAPRAEPVEISRKKDVPPLAPLPPVPVPDDNPQTPAKITLGTRLFCEPLLSGNGQLYCSTCHMPQMGWGDGSDLSQGLVGTLHWRNSQTLFNAAYFTKHHWDGSELSLEEQARTAITSNLSGNGDPTIIEERLAKIPEYVALFKEAYGVERPHFDGVLKALAAFQRDVPISRKVPFDDYMKGDKSAVSDAAARGKELFEEKAGCLQCHNGPLVSDQGFHATGVPRNPVFDEVPMRQIAVRYQHVIRGVPEEVYRDVDVDTGLYLTTLREKDIGKFRTPSLRELKHTAPYMHNGVFKTLPEVVEFYDKGGGETPNKSPLLQPLKLTADQKGDLIAFLESLSGEKGNMLPMRQPRRP